jgi:hypothetical protein
MVNCPTNFCWRGEKNLRAKILEFFYQFHNTSQFCGLSTFFENNPNYYPDYSIILRLFATDTITDPSKMINCALGVSMIFRTSMFNASLTKVSSGFVKFCVLNIGLHRLA